MNGLEEWALKLSTIEILVRCSKIVLDGRVILRAFVWVALLHSRAGC